ncbi:MAG: hypothetical protein OIN88_12860 [Candidatus Methanoperedens sp.]|nr:hypothetical protein [Candidatus Methanoperedens sp.]MCZ7360306.1 hypothetical protein [Candidatus Methanoperedens sp.]HLB69904.1 RNA-binding domain-containing protein [Candidatus Methanoperedens sp.]
MNVTVRVSALVHPTEIEEKVRTAITNIFPVELNHQDFGIPGLFGEGNLDDLRNFHLLLREYRILDTARHVLLTGIEDNSIHFNLNKQVAFVGKVNFPAGEESLGSIYIEIYAENKEDLLRIIDWLAPGTVEGKPVEEIEL